MQASPNLPRIEQKIKEMVMLGHNDLRVAFYVSDAEAAFLRSLGYRVSMKHTTSGQFVNGESHFLIEW
jgi:hypothetical protein